MRTRLRLQPVKYQIKLFYLGHDRIRHDRRRYRCRYELQEGTTTITAVPALIANRVRDNETTAEANRAANPAEHGGNSTNPPSDQVYRVMIRDNHALRRADTRFLGDGGNNRSRPDSYRARGWMPDVRPAVPFRVVVRKFVGTRQVDIDARMRVMVEVKDPVEEFDQNTARRRTFLEGFFGVFNRTDTDPDVGDDNALQAFDGGRPPSAAHSGVQANRVLRRVTYVSPPVADAAPAGGRVRFNQLRTAQHCGRGNMNVRFNLRRVDFSGNKVGVADFAFRPWAQGGDNYRFLLTLLNRGNQDVRQTRMNGAAVTVTDDADRPLPHPRGYVTGRMIVWKRVDVRLVVLVNGNQAADLDWTSNNGVRGVYRPNFIELHGPEDTFTLSRAAWRAEVRNEFGQGGAFAAQFANDANFNGPAADPDAIYRRGLLPTFLHGLSRNRIADGVENVARNIIAHACGRLVPAVTAPNRNTRQRNSEGLFVCFLRLHNPRYRGAGRYIGDRSYWCRHLGSVPMSTSTAAHEIGHAFYLRHAHTTRPQQAGGADVRVEYVDAGGTSNDVRLILAHTNNWLEDHDQVDAYACLLSYTRPVVARPCGVCNLALRFYDRVQVQRRHRQEIMDGLTPVRICRLETVSAAHHRITETLPNLNRNQAMELVAISRERPTTDRAGTNRRGRVNVSRSGRGHRWRVTGARFQLLEDRIRIRAGTRRQIQVRYTCGDLSANATINVNA